MQTTLRLLNLPLITVLYLYLIISTGCMPQTPHPNATVLVSPTASPIVGEITPSPSLVTSEATTTLLLDQEMISRASDGAAGNGYSLNPSISADGRWVAFESLANNLVPNDTNSCDSTFAENVTDGFCPDVFVRDRESQTTVRVSVASDGTQADGESFAAKIANDGQSVAFFSRARNLVADYETVCDLSAYPENCLGLYWHDLQTSQTQLVAVISDNGGIGSGYTLALSSDGNWLVFNANEPLTDYGSNEESQIYSWNRVTNTLKVISLNSDEVLGNRGSFAPTISADGRTVAFASYASNLFPSDTNDREEMSLDVFISDQQTQQIELISRSIEDTPANDNSNAPIISGDGTIIGFSSRASNLAAAEYVECQDPQSGTCSCPNIFIADPSNQSIERISPSEANTIYGSPQLSADGQLITYLASRNDEVPKLMIYDRTNRETSLVLENEIFAPALSADGQWITFGSEVALIPEDTQTCFLFQRETNCWDIYALRRQGGSNGFIP